jgi:hypothetical protein
MAQAVPVNEKRRPPTPSLLDPPSSLTSSTPVTLLTVATDRARPEVIAWEYSARCAGWRDVRIVGDGESWGGWRWRAGRLSEYLHTEEVASGLDPGRLVLVTDAYDVFMLRGPERAAQLLRPGVATKCQASRSPKARPISVTVGVERVCHWITSLLPVPVSLIRRTSCGYSRALERAHPGWTINGGCFGGPAREVRAALDFVAGNADVDQHAWGKLADADSLALPTLRFDVERLLVRNVFPAIVPSQLAALYFSPQTYMEGEVAALSDPVGGPVCVHAPGGSADGNVRYLFLCEALGFASPGPAQAASRRLVRRSFARLLAAGVFLALVVVVVCGTAHLTRRSRDSGA